MAEETTESSGVDVFYGRAKRAFYIESASGVSLSKLVDLTIFGDFLPGITIDQAKIRFGPPIRTDFQRSEGTEAIYKRPNAHIVVLDQLQGSSCGSYRRRTVSAYPKPSVQGCSITSVEMFDISVSKLIPQKGSVEVEVAEAGGGQRVWVLIQDNCVKGINWWSPRSMSEN